MPTITIPGMFLTGNHAGRPAASAVGSGAIYSCSTHSLLYQSDGSSWSTWANLAGTGLVDPMTTRGDIIVRNSSNATARLGVGAANKFLHSDGTDPAWASVLPADLDVSADNTTADATTGHHGLLPKLGGGTTNFLRADGTWNAPAGGGAVDWVQNVNESGASIANWTSITGTWSSDGTIIQQTVVAGWQELDFTALLPLGLPVIAEAEMRFPTAGQGTGSFIQCGFVVGSMGLILDKAAQTFEVTDWKVQDFRAPAMTIALDTWYKMRVVMVGDWVSVYKAGTLVLTARTGGAANADYFRLVGYNSKADYRNIKLWTLSAGVPA